MTLGERGSGDSEFELLQILPRELDRLPTNDILFSGIFLVRVGSFLSGDLLLSSLGEDLRVAKKLRVYKKNQLERLI